MGGTTRKMPTNRRGVYKKGKKVTSDRYLDPPWMILDPRTSLDSLASLEFTGIHCIVLGLDDIGATDIAS